MNEANAELTTKDPNGQPIKVNQGLGPLEWVSTGPTSALSKLEQGGMKVDRWLLTKPWFKDMANGSWTGRGGELTKAAQEARKAYASAIKDFGLPAGEAGEAAASRFKYLLERVDGSILKQEGTGASKLGDLDELEKLKERLGNTIPNTSGKALNYRDMFDYLELNKLPNPTTEPSKEALDFIKETFKRMSK